MKISGKFFAVVGLAIGVAALSFAQQAGPSGGTPTPGAPGQGRGGKGGGADFMKRREAIEDAALQKAGATPDQMKQVKALRKKEGADRKAMMDKFKPTTPPTPGQRPQLTPEQKAAIKKMREENEAAMKKILGSKYDAYVAALKASMPQMGGRGGHGGPGGGGPGAGAPGGGGA